MAEIYCRVRWIATVVLLELPEATVEIALVRQATISSFWMLSAWTDGTVLPAFATQPNTTEPSMVESLFSALS